MRCTRRVAALAMSATLLVVATGMPASAGTTTKPCKLVTARALRSAIGIPFEVLSDDPTLCFWGSKPDAPLATAIVGIDTSLSGPDLAGAKQSERGEDGAAELGGIADLAIYRPVVEPGTTSEGASLVVFDDDVVVRVVVMAEDSVPTKAQMRRLATVIERRL